MSETALAVVRKERTCPKCKKSVALSALKQHTRCLLDCYVCKRFVDALSHAEHQARCPLRCTICSKNFEHQLMPDHFLEHMPTRQFVSEPKGSGPFRGPAPSRIDVLTAHWPFMNARTQTRNTFFAKLFLKIGTEMFPGKRMQVLPMVYALYSDASCLDSVQVIITDY